MPLLECRDLSLGHPGNIAAEGVTFTVSRGDYLCILGPNGAGKSTLVQTLLGLLRPVKGEVLLGEGFSLEDIGYLPQHTETREDFPASVGEVVCSGLLHHCALRPWYGRALKKRAAGFMEDLGITALEKQSFHDLSGGQQQRVRLARALCAARSMLLLDEPVTGLDPQAAAEFYDILARLRREQDMTVVMVSHDLGAALDQASHVLYLDHGRGFFGTREEFCTGHPEGRRAR